MSQILTLKLSDKAFTSIRQKAKIIGVTPEYFIASLLEQQFGQVFKSLLTEVEGEAARARFERHFGTLGSSRAVRIDNESIDDDLAREYASTHEGE
jgi:hypothetical protein